MDSEAKAVDPRAKVRDETGESDLGRADRAGSEAERVRVDDLDLQLEQMRDRWMRAEAEIANIRTRSRRDVDEARQFAIQKFAADVVEMVENLQRGVASLPAASESESEMVTRLRDGFSGIEHSFVSLLERNGIKRQDPTGAVFDPELHQAMEQRTSAAHPPGTVLQAWTSAWTLNGRLLRPAMVVVSTDSQPARSANAR